MGEWITERLESVTETQKAGGTPTSSNTEYYKGEIPFVVIEDLTKSSRFLSHTEKHITEKGLKNSAAWLITTPHILYSMYATVGKPIINKITCTTNQAIIALKTNSRIDQNYLFYYLVLIRPKVYKYTAQTTQSNLNAQAVKNIPIFYPKNILVQKKIATILTTIDTAIEKTQQLIDKYRKIKTGMMNDLFTRGIGADGKLRTPRSEAPELYKKTELGWIPKEWEVETIQNITEFVTSGSRGWAIYYSEEGAKFVRIGNLNRENIHLRLKDMKYVAVDNITEGKRTRLIGGDVLISITADLGIIGLVPDNFGEAYINQHIALVRPIDNLIEGEWIATWLTIETMKNIFQILDDPGAKSGLNLPTIRNLQIGIPEINERKKILKILNDNDNYILNLQGHVSKLQKQKAGLMQDLLTGKVEVTVPEKEVGNV